MTRTLACFVFSACLALASPVGATASASAAAAAPGTPARAAARAGARPRASAARTAAAARTLEDIRIEGEIPVPQVLFITARDPWRMLDFQHRRYLRTGAQLGQATEPPRWIVVSQVPIPAGKETAR